MKFHLARWLCAGVESNVERARAETRAAVAGGCRVVVFPELFLTGYSRSMDPKTARELFAELSTAAGDALLVFGSISEGGCNRTTAWSGGRQLAVYDKVHLFRPNREHELWEPGDRYVALSWKGRRIGLMNCNDVRFPEQARALRLQARCEILIVPAWWPWRRDHIWRTLLQARAAENQVWVLGCAVAGSLWPDEQFAGAGNHVFDPAGEVVRTPDDRTYELDFDHPPPTIVDPLEQYVAVDRVEVFGD
jgi:predicted amidohydrolase